MKTLTTFVLLCMLLPAGLAVAQDSTRTSYFPYQTGDFWIHQTYDQLEKEVVSETLYRVYADSTDSTGVRHIFVEEQRNTNSPDSLNFKVLTNGDIYSNWYCWNQCNTLRVLKHSTTQPDSFWIGGKVSEEQYVRFTLLDRWEQQLNGESREHRQVAYSTTSDTTDPNSGLQSIGTRWTEGLGITSQFGYEGNLSTYLKGAWIAGETYGDTAFTPVVVDTLRNDFFPYETGDFWVYGIRTDWGNPPTEKVKYRVYADSTDVENTKWVYVEKNVNGVIDSVYYKVMASGDIYSDDLVGTEMLKFKFKDTSEGDYWVGGTLDDGHYGVYNLRNIGFTDIFYTPQKVFESRGINYYAVQDTSNWSTTEKVREHWTASFGITSITYYDNPDAVAWGAQGIYKDGQVYGDTTFTIVTSKESEQEIPSSFTLSQNYPNPFNPSTTMEYEVARPSYLSVTLYTYTGQKIAEIYKDKFHQAGNYSLSIDQGTLGSLASSLLIVRFQTQTEVQYIKMVYLK